MLKGYIDCCAKMRLHGVSLLRKLKARVSLTKYLSHCLINCLSNPLSAFCLVHLYSFRLFGLEGLFRSAPVAAANSSNAENDEPKGQRQ